MNNNGWFTLKDVLNDLEAVTGGRAGKIDAKFTVTGEEPPPHHLTDKEDETHEIMQMYGDCTSKDGKILQPDLSGIKQMLKMVNDHCNHPTYDENENIEELTKEANTVVIISKLNPNVTEFVPRSISNNNVINDNPSAQENGEQSHCSNQEFEPKENKDSIGNNSQGENLANKKTYKTDSSHKDTKSDDLDVSKKIDVSNLNSDEITNMKEKLLHKIIDTSKAACLKKKQERNLALASLLKLNAKSPVKLMTPDYYKTVPGNELKKSSSHIKDSSNSCIENNRIEYNNESDANLNNITTGQCPEKVDDILPDTDIVKTESPCTDTASSLSLQNSTTDSVLKQDSNIYLSKEMKESVKKVDEWLNKPEKRKTKISSVHLGPVTFKRKGDVSVSPSVDNAGTIERPSSASESFVPSSYANELSKIFTERSKAKEIQSEDIWTRVERKLKEKDKILLNQQ